VVQLDQIVMTVQLMVILVLLLDLVEQLLVAVAVDKV
tara:strand:- start:646 stop:756 length:111 start_codon:yes stop_codon:yes gene_type:complete